MAKVVYMAGGMLVAAVAEMGAPVEAEGRVEDAVAVGARAEVSEEYEGGGVVVEEGLLAKVEDEMVGQVEAAREEGIHRST